MANGLDMLRALAVAGALDTVGGYDEEEDDDIQGALDLVGLMLPKIGASPAKKARLALAAKLGRGMPAAGAGGAGGFDIALGNALRNAGITAAGTPALAAMDQVATTRTGVTGMPSTLAEIQRATTSSTDFDVSASTGGTVAPGAAGTALVVAPVAFKPILLTVDQAIAPSFRVTSIQIGRVTYNLAAGPGTSGAPATIYSTANQAGGRRVMYDPLDAGQTMTINVVNTSAVAAVFEMIIGALAVGRSERIAQSLGVGFG
ncbi:MAG TPA: hypothetical protein PLF26_20950 [Blastocatellia bacterium]|nr:hypothetical protein [Blastocatellia bacterium]